MRQTATSDEATNPNRPDVASEISPLGLMRLAMQRHTAMFKGRMIGGLTQTQFATMARLLTTGPCSQNHLGRLVYLDASTINGVIGRLLRRSLVAAEDDPMDIRRRIISLTRKGRTLIRKAIVVATDVNRDTLNVLTVAEQEQLRSLLGKLALDLAAEAGQIKNQDTANTPPLAAPLREMPNLCSSQTKALRIAKQPAGSTPSSRVQSRA